MSSFEGLDTNMTYARKMTTLRPGRSSYPQLTGVLFVEGFTQYGMEYHLNNMMKLSWPVNVGRYLFKWQRDRPAELAQVIEENRFRMIVIPGMCGDWRYQYGRRRVEQHRAHLTRLEASLKAAVEVQGKPMHAHPAHACSPPCMGQPRMGHAPAGLCLPPGAARLLRFGDEGTTSGRGAPGPVACMMLHQLTMHL